MTKEQKEGVIKAIQDDYLYDFIATNYCDFTTYDLKDILLEVIWANGNKDELLENIKERIMYDDED